MSSYSYFGNNDPEYRKLKRDFRCHQACARCGSYKTGEMTVDHIIPMWKFEGSYKNTANWQVLCRTCHLIKTREDGYGAGYVHETLESKGSFSLSDKIDKQLWYSLRSLLEDTFVSSLDVYISTQAYMRYLVDKLVINENQKKAVNSLKFDNPKLTKILSASVGDSKLIDKLESITNRIGNSHLSSLISNDDSYLIVEDDFSGKDYIKLERREHYRFFKYFFDNNAPSRLSIFENGVQNELKDYVFYLKNKKTNKQVPAIAILGYIFTPNLNSNQDSLCIIFNPETMRFSFAIDTAPISK